MKIKVISNNRHLLLLHTITMFVTNLTLTTISSNLSLVSI